MNLKVELAHSKINILKLSLAPLKQVSDFHNYPKHLDTFYYADPKICMRQGEKSYRDYVNFPSILFKYHITIRKEKQ